MIALLRGLASGSARKATLVCELEVCRTWPGSARFPPLYGMGSTAVSALRAALDERGVSFLD